MKTSRPNAVDGVGQTTADLRVRISRCVITLSSAECFLHIIGSFAYGSLWANSSIYSVLLKKSHTHQVCRKMDQPEIWPK